MGQLNQPLIIYVIANTVMAESGLGGRFWFKAAAAGTDARNATFKARIKTSPHQALIGAPKDVSRCRGFRCKAVVYLNKEHLDNGTYGGRCNQSRFAGNISSYVLHIQERKTLMTSNQAKFNEHKFNSGSRRWLNNFFRTIPRTNYSNQLRKSTCHMVSLQ